MRPALPRRRLLGATVATGAAAAVVGPPSISSAGPAPLPPRPTKPSATFAHGVASGDPGATQVVLWTRVSTAAQHVEVTWEVAIDRAMRHVVRRGRFRTSASRDHTVKLTAGGLRPATWYYYRFAIAGQRTNRSRIGRTRTTPGPDASPDRVRLGFVSCANVQRGWFNAYRHLAQRADLHAVVHLGDYLYEGYSDDPSETRTHLPEREILSLADYRERHAQYKADPDLQDLHAAMPMIAMWDDHETANDAWRAGAGNHTEGDGEGGEGSYLARRARAHRAYDEWMPARLDGTVRLNDGHRLFRSVRFGRLAHLHLMDLRSYRDQQIADLTDTEVDDPDRTITGRAQLDWIKQSLSDSQAQWQLVGNPVLIAPLSLGGLPPEAADALNLLLGGAVSSNGVPLNTDAWDGYTDDRRELFAHITDEGIDDVVFLTGDIHTGLAADLPLDKATYPLGGTAGVEIVCASVTSDNFKDDTGTPPHTTSDAIAVALRASNPHFAYANLDDHGFCVLDVAPHRIQCDWWVIDSREDPEAGIRHDVSFVCRAGSGRLTAVSEPVET